MFFLVKTRFDEAGESKLVQMGHYIKWKPVHRIILPILCWRWFLSMTSIHPIHPLVWNEMRIKPTRVAVVCTVLLQKTAVCRTYVHSTDSIAREEQTRKISARFRPRGHAAAVIALSQAQSHHHPRPIRTTLWTFRSRRRLQFPKQDPTLLIETQTRIWLVHWDHHLLPLLAILLFFPIELFITWHCIFPNQKMEVVASPLTFNHSMSLTKRRRACSPMVDIGTDSGTSDDFIMTDDSQYHHIKKRRIGSMDEGFTAPLPMSSFSSPFQSSPMNHTAKQFSGKFWYPSRICIWPFPLASVFFNRSHPPLPSRLRISETISSRRNA